LEKYITTYAFRDLRLRHHRISKYKAAWATAPFPPTFVTADVVCVCSGHVLLITRGDSGEYALPGGFIKQNERVQDAALRELKEETGIRVDKIILESSIIESRVFDFPDRSERGRTITHGFYIKLKDGRLPEVRGNDDAASAFWMPIAEVFRNERKFFEDHASIIQCFVNRG
jgi:bifunctional NMN adenylyltransferase/nudix hydrolase